jgi:hypothetical protein
MKTIEITTRTIGEWLEYNKKVAEKIIEKYRDINTDFDWYNYTIEEFVGEMESKGLDIDPKNVKFSGFWSQGDGASFTCDLSSKYINEWSVFELAEILDIPRNELVFGKDMQMKIIKNL